MKLFPLPFHLFAFEVTFIETSNSALCRQKECMYSLKYTNDIISLILFQLITAHFFSIAAPFFAFSILTILLDKYQMKSVENVNILVKIKLCCLKNFFFVWKKLLFEKKHVFEKISCHVFEKKMFLKKSF